MSAFLTLRRGAALAAGVATLALVPLAATLLAILRPGEATGEATAFVAAMLAGASLGPVAGGVALALDRPRTAAVLAVLPVVLGLLALVVTR